MDLNNKAQVMETESRIMPFPTLLEHLSAVTERVRKVEASLQSGGARLLLPPFAETHVFLMGDADKVEESITEVWEDLDAEMRSRVPMPFRDITLVVQMAKGSMDYPGIPAQFWSVTRIIQAPDLVAGKPAEMGPAAEAFIVFDYAVADSGRSGSQQIQAVWFEGRPGGAFGVGLSDTIFIRNDKAVTAARGNQEQRLAWAKSNMRMVSAISHPANYVVQVTPALSSKEERRGAAGKPRPPAKAPHFIVVDHEVLVRMSGRMGGTHASPVPHERRGHWRRLAERCRHARLTGAERTWVGPAYVGERTFSDGKNAYEVLLDFRTRA